MRHTIALHCRASCKSLAKRQPHLVSLPGDAVKKAGISKPGRPSRKATRKPIKAPIPASSESSEDIKDDQDDDVEWKATAAEPDGHKKTRDEADYRQRKHVSFAEPLSSAAPAKAKQTAPGLRDATAKPPAKATGAAFAVACRLTACCIIIPTVIVHGHAIVLSATLEPPVVA